MRISLSVQLILITMEVYLQFIQFPFLMRYWKFIFCYVTDIVDVCCCNNVFIEWKHSNVWKEKLSYYNAIFK